MTHQSTLTTNEKGNELSIPKENTKSQPEDSSNVAKTSLHKLHTQVTFEQFLTYTNIRELIADDLLNKCPNEFGKKRFKIDQYARKKYARYLDESTRHKGMLKHLVFLADPEEENRKTIEEDKQTLQSTSNCESQSGALLFATQPKSVFLEPQPDERVEVPENFTHVTFTALRNRPEVCKFIMKGMQELHGEMLEDEDALLDYVIEEFLKKIKSGTCQTLQWNTLFLLDEVEEFRENFHEPGIESALAKGAYEQTTHIPMDCAEVSCENSSNSNPKDGNIKSFEYFRPEVINENKNVLEQNIDLKAISLEDFVQYSNVENYLLKYMKKTYSIHYDKYAIRMGYYLRRFYKKFIQGKDVWPSVIQFDFEEFEMSVRNRKMNLTLEIKQQEAKSLEKSRNKNDCLEGGQSLNQFVSNSQNCLLNVSHISMPKAVNSSLLESNSNLNTTFVVRNSSRINEMEINQNYQTQSYYMNKMDYENIVTKQEPCSSSYGSEVEYCGALLPYHEILGDDDDVASVNGCFEEMMTSPAKKKQMCTEDHPAGESLECIETIELPMQSPLNLFASNENDEQFHGEEDPLKSPIKLSVVEICDDATDEDRQAIGSKLPKKRLNSLLLSSSGYKSKVRPNVKSKNSSYHKQTDLRNVRKNGVIKRKNLAKRKKIIKLNNSLMTSDDIVPQKRHHINPLKLICKKNFELISRPPTNRDPVLFHDKECNNGICDDNLDFFIEDASECEQPCPNTRDVINASQLLNVDRSLFEHMKFSGESSKTDPIENIVCGTANSLTKKAEAEKQGKESNPKISIAASKKGKLTIVDQRLIAPKVYDISYLFLHGVCINFTKFGYKDHIPFKLFHNQPIQAVVRHRNSNFNWLQVYGESVRFLLNMTEYEWSSFLHIANAVKCFEYSSRGGKPVGECLPRKILYYLFKTLPFFAQIRYDFEDTNNGSISCKKINPYYLMPKECLTRDMDRSFLEYMETLR